MREDVDYEKLATPAEKQQWARQNNLMYGGLIAIGVVILQGFLTASPLGASGRISVIAFAISLPLLAVLILIEELQSGDKSVGPSMTDEAAKTLALLGSLTGVVAAFWHIDWSAGIAILAAGIVALGVYGAHFSGTSFSQAAQRRRQQRAAAQQARAAAQPTQQPANAQRFTQPPIPPQAGAIQPDATQFGSSQSGSAQPTSTQPSPAQKDPAQPTSPQAGQTQQSSAQTDPEQPTSVLPRLAKPDAAQPDPEQTGSAQPAHAHPTDPRPPAEPLPPTSPEQAYPLDPPTQPEQQPPFGPRTPEQ